MPNDKLSYKKYRNQFADILFNIWGSLYLRNYNIDDTIMVASSARGGSTWLAQILSTISGYPLLWEPLHLGTSPSCKEYGFNWGTYLRNDERDEMKYQYIKNVLTGQNLSTELISSMYFNPKQFIFFKGFLVKFTLANFMLHWILNHFPLKCILMIRHPCAVVSSRLNHSAWDNVNIDNFYVQPEIFEDYPHLMDIYTGIKTKEELIAFSWVMQTLIPLSQPRPHKWYLLTYEKLLIDGIDEFSKIFSYLDKEIPTDAYKMFETPSKTTMNSSNIMRNNKQLLSWKENLSLKQVDLILKVVHSSGIEFYNEEIEPDYDGLLNFKI